MKNTNILILTMPQGWYSNFLQNNSLCKGQNPFHSDNNAVKGELGNNDQMEIYPVAAGITFLNGPSM